MCLGSLQTPTCPTFTPAKITCQDLLRLMGSCLKNNWIKIKTLKKGYGST
jgi:hypothetical protein